MAAAAQTETTASGAANKALARRFMEEVFNRGNLAVVEELWKPNQIESGTRAVQSVRTAFPDYHRTIEAQVAEGDLVVTRWTMRGTHRGPYRSGALGRYHALVGVLRPAGTGRAWTDWTGAAGGPPRRPRPSRPRVADRAPRSPLAERRPRGVRAPGAAGVPSTERPADRRRRAGAEAEMDTDALARLGISPG